MNSHKIKTLCLFLATLPMVGVAPYLHAECFDAPAFATGGVLIDSGDYAGAVLLVGQPTVGLVENGDAFAHVGAVPAWFNPLPGDLNGDLCVNFPDLSTLLGNYGCEGCECIGDLDRDGDVDLSDLTELLGNYGKGPGCP